jgi:putative membrane protein
MKGMRMSRDTPSQQPDPPPSEVRDHLANERTLLAWVRTSIAIMALGFVVARFGLLIRELRPASVPHATAAATGISTAFGTILVLCGALVAVLSLLRYLRTGRAIEAGAYRWSPLLNVLLALALALAGILLAVYLVLTA